MPRLREKQRLREQRFSGITLGIPDEDPDLRPRLPLEAVVHRNGYHIPSDEEITSWYREGDETWRDRFDNEWSEERRAKFHERGSDKRAEDWTIGHYTEEFTKREAEGLLANLKRAGFRLA